MASSITLSFSSLRTPQPRTAAIPATFSLPTPPATTLRFPTSQKRKTVVVSAVGDVSVDGNNYLIAGAIAVALIGTAFPILFSRKDLCPECDGAGFIRKSGVTLRANAARKDESQIVCARCNGLGKLGQIDKY